jgi:hypothetical protein
MSPVLQEVIALTIVGFAALWVLKSAFRSVVPAEKRQGKMCGTCPTCEKD